MTKTVIVKMISATGCERCKEVKERLVAAANRIGVALDLKVLDSSTNEAVALGIKHLLDDVPSLVISGKSFCGTEFSDKELEKAMRNAK